MLLSRALRVQPKEVVALVGGGGKTTLMFRLARELVTTGKRVVTTMTTKISIGQMAAAPACLSPETGGLSPGSGELSPAMEDLLPGSEDALWAQLPQKLREHGHVLVVGGMAPEEEKVLGVPPDWVARIAALPDVDVVIVEADGSRGRSLKAPAPHEPVIPAGTTITIPVVGLDVLGRPLTAEYVHRPQIVATLTDAAAGSPITPAMIATVLAHPLGGAKNVPPGGRLVPFLNKVEDETALAAARQIARLLLAAPADAGSCAGLDSVLIGAAQGDDPVREVCGRVAAVVLAAGRASRFGSLKQLLPWGGVPLVAHVANQALACPDVDRVVVTIGAGAEQVATALGRTPVVLVPDWAEGQSRSVQAGLKAVLPGVAAVLFLLADQPGVCPELLSALIRRHRQTLAPVVAPCYRGQRGNPVLFDRATFGEFAGLQGDIGARPIVQAHWDEIAWLDWPTPEILQDIDIRPSGQNVAQAAGLSAPRRAQSGGSRYRSIFRADAYAGCGATADENAVGSKPRSTCGVASERHRGRHSALLRA